MLDGLMASIGKTTTTSNTAQGLSRGFHDISQGESLFGGSRRLLARRSTTFTGVAVAMKSV
jgi:hypothetical protein